MVLRLFRAMWFLSVLVVFASLLYVYAGLPEKVVILEDTRTSVSREWLFYTLMVSILAINATVYILKSFLPRSEDLRAWFHGLIITVNVFLIISMQALSVYNSLEAFDDSRVVLFVVGSLGLVIIWAICWPAYLLAARFFPKAEV